jgi:uncharacterized protein (DUF58 family)
METEAASDAVPTGFECSLVMEFDSVSPNSSKSPPAISITPEGWIYLVILAFISIGSVLRNVNLLILMSGMMIAPLLINWRMGVLRGRTLAAKRSIPFRVHAKQLSTLQWICINHSSITAWGVEIDDVVGEEKSTSETPLAETEISQRVGVENFWNGAFRRKLLNAVLQFMGLSQRKTANYNVRLQLAAIAGQQQEAVSSRLYFSKRGAYRFGPAQLITKFPFGLIQTKIEIDSTERFYVAPQVGILTPVWHRRVRSVLTGSDALLKRRGLAGDDFYALRRWRSGDSQKLIHWRTSAKHGYPIVKQFEQPDNRDFAMLIDLFSPPSNGGRELANQSCETALSFATTVILNISTAVRGRIAVGVCGTETIIFKSRSLREMIENSMRVLATVQPTASPDLTSRLVEVADSVSAYTPIYVISSRQKIDPFQADPRGDSVELGQLQNIWNSVVWITVGSPEFAELFQTPNEAEGLRSLAQKWIEHVPH